MAEPSRVKPVVSGQQTIGAAETVIGDLTQSAADLLSHEKTLSKFYRFGPILVEMDIRAGRMADLALPAIEHAAGSGNPPEHAQRILVRAVEFNGNPPPAFEHLARSLPGNGHFTYLTEGNRFHGLWQSDSRVLESYDGATAQTLYLADRADSIATWELAAPLRRLIHWHCLGRNQLVVHGGVVQIDGVGILMTGLSGSGKSTVTARAIDAGHSSAGDDMVLVDLDGDRPIAYALFDVLKLGTHSRRGLGFPDRVDWSFIDSDGGKRRCAISAIRPDALRRSVSLDAILMPTLFDDLESDITSTGSLGALRAMAPSTMQILRGGEKQTLPKMVELSRRLPCYDLKVGTDPAELIACLSRLAERVRS